MQCCQLIAYGFDHFDFLFSKIFWFFEPIFSVLLFVKLKLIPNNERSQPLSCDLKFKVSVVVVIQWVIYILDSVCFLKNCVSNQIMIFWLSVKKYVLVSSPIDFQIRPTWTIAIFHLDNIFKIQIVIEIIKIKIQIIANDFTASLPCVFVCFCMVFAISLSVVILQSCLLS